MCTPDDGRKAEICSTYFFFFFDGLGSLACSHSELINSEIMNSLDEWSTRRKAATYTGQLKRKKRRQTSLPLVGFEPTIPVFERAKTFHTLDNATTVIGALNT
jgi:hypothetical protein